MRAREAMALVARRARGDEAPVRLPLESYVELVAELWAEIRAFGRGVPLATLAAEARLTLPPIRIRGVDFLVAPEVLGVAVGSERPARLRGRGESRLEVEARFVATTGPTAGAHARDPASAARRRQGTARGRDRTDAVARFTGQAGRLLRERADRALAALPAGSFRHPAWIADVLADAGGCP